MATSKPRITITLEPRVYEVVARLSRANGESMSSIVTGFLEVAVPPMERMVVLMEQALAAPEEARAGLAASLAEAEKRILPDLVHAIGQADMFVVEATKDVKRAAPRSGAERPRGAPGALPTPVAVTRGSGPRKGAPAGKAKRGGGRG